jgi:Glycosyltransferase family 87
MDTHSALGLSAKLRLWAGVLLLFASVMTAYDLSTPGLLDRTGRVKGSDYIRLYVTGMLAGERRWTEFFDGDAHVATARATINRGLTMSGLRPNYSPAVGLALAPLTHLPFLASLYVFSVCSVVAFAGAVWLVVRAAGHLQSEVATVALCALAFPALFDTLRYGQLSAFTLLAFSFAAVLWRSDRRVTAGMALGLVAYKPNLLVGPAIVLLAAGEWRILVGLGMGALAETAISLAFSGMATMVQYVSTLMSLARDPSLVQIHPQELHSWRGLFQLVAPEPWAGALTLAGTVATIGIAALIWRRTPDWRPRWSAITITAVLTSPHLLTYDLLLLALPLLLVADWMIERHQPVPGGVWIGLLLVYFSALLSPFVALVTHLQVSTLAMAWLLAYLARAPSRHSI